MPEKSWESEVLAMLARIKHSDDCQCVCARDCLVAVVVADAIKEGVVAAATLGGAPALLRTIDGGLQAMKVLTQAQPTEPKGLSG